MPHVTLTMELPSRLIASLQTQLDKTDKNLAIREIMNVMNGLLGGAYENRGYARACIASASATQTVTCTFSAAVADTDTLVIGGTTLACKTTPTTEAHYGIGTTNATLATNLCNAINANTAISKLVRATVAANVVTITALVPGPAGNQITTTEAGNGNVLGQASVMANGASDEVDGYAFGYEPAV